MYRILMRHETFAELRVHTAESVAQLVDSSDQNDYANVIMFSVQQPGSDWFCHE